MSSVVYVGVGQCGSQILESFVNHEINSNRRSYNYLLSNNDKLRCIFVDSEAKVVNKIKNESSFRKNLREENLLSGLNGRGSNWCYGYNGCKTAPNISGDVLNAIRREVERCDNYIGLVMCHSIGGGTGSGYGSKLTELIRDELQLHQIVNSIVAPSDVGGDSPLQYYNCLLSLASLNRSSDGIILFHNDSLLNQLGFDFLSPIKSAKKDYKSFSDFSPNANLSFSSNPTHKASITSVNSLIASQMGSLLSPCSSLYPWNLNNSQVNIEMNEMLRSLCPFPDAKIIRCVLSNPISEITRDWKDLAKSTMFQLKHGYGNVYDTISSICCYRGTGKGDEHLPSLLTMQQQLNAKMHFVDWNKADALDVWMDLNPKQPKQISLAFNSGCIVNYLRHIKMKSMEKFNSSAYLHWYYRFGGSKEIFLESFDVIDQITSQYMEIS